MSYIDLVFFILSRRSIVYRRTMKTKLKTGTAARWKQNSNEIKNKIQTKLKIKFIK
jgi:hypothetical protein